ncbi:MAG TPA: SIMPL domain-containing protein [Allosphingosinicella sp.]|nr:SIMPL domain-containing protein [Allosphingosinicella sp.]
MADRLIDSRNNVLLIAAALLALAIVVGGYLLGDGVRRARMADRAVTVRGLAERNVTADLATWTIAYSEQGTELGPVQAAVDQKRSAVRAFFKRHGFADADLSDAGASVNQYYDNNRGQNSVTVRQRIQLRTKDVMRARRAFARQADLIRSGVALEDGSGMVYSFTRLNAIKPEMIAEATRNARESARQFARDSGTGVGGIRSATQGYFSIGARDGDVDGEGGSSAGDSPFQKVRVVTTVDFYLD